MSKSALIIVTYCPDSFCPLNKPCKGIFDKYGQILAVSKLDGTGMITLWGRWARETKYQIIEE